MSTPTSPARSSTRTAAVFSASIPDTSRHPNRRLSSCRANASLSACRPVPRADMLPKTWFITGTSTGLGRAWAIAALERGDRVAGTSRDVSRLADLAETYRDRMLPTALDVTDRPAVFDAVAQA